MTTSGDFQSARHLIAVLVIDGKLSAEQAQPVLECLQGEQEDIEVRENTRCRTCGEPATVNKQGFCPDCAKWIESASEE